MAGTTDADTGNGLSRILEKPLDTLGNPVKYRLRTLRRYAWQAVLRQYLAAFGHERKRDFGASNIHANCKTVAYVIYHLYLGRRLKPGMSMADASTIRGGPAATSSA